MVLYIIFSKDSVIYDLKKFNSYKFLKLDQYFNILQWNLWKTRLKIVIKLITIKKISFFIEKKNLLKQEEIIMSNKIFSS